MKHKIHAIWLGEKMTPLSLICLDDWRKQGYSYRLWTESDPEIIDWINSCVFARECYNRKLFAFVTDYLRLKVLQKEGGLYLDTDVTIRRNPFVLFDEVDFCVGYETESFFGTAVIYSKKNSKILNEIIDFYENKIMQSNLYIGPQVVTHIVNNLNTTNKLFKAPKKFFYSYDAGGKLPRFSDENYLVHWFQYSWRKQAGLHFLKSKHKGIFGKFYEWQKQFFNF